MIKKVFNVFMISLISLGNFFILPVKNIRAADSDIKINEVMYDPSDGVEWVELYNNGLDSVDLNDWVITDEDAAPEYIFTSSVIIPAYIF
jgi:hypothetical protein